MTEIKRGVDMEDDRGPNDLDKTIDILRRRMKELLAINVSNRELMSRLVKENEELKKDNKRLAKQVEDYFNAR